MRVVSVLVHETSAVTNDFNHSSEDYANFVSIYSSAKMMSSENDSQNSGRQSRGFRSWIYLASFKYSIQQPQILYHISISCIYLLSSS